MSDFKQVIVIAKYLNMRKGKCVAQGCHASLGAYLEALRQSPATANAWLAKFQTKICVSVDSEKELLDLYDVVKASGLPCALIKDAGFTEFKEPTYTCIAVGPAPSEEIDKFTGGLKLL